MLTNKNNETIKTKKQLRAIVTGVQNALVVFERGAIYDAKANLVACYTNIVNKNI